MTQDQLDYLLDQIKELKQDIEKVRKEVLIIKNSLPDNFQDLRITGDGSIEEVAYTCEALTDDSVY
jgi:septal ring factor EnvC (AmiA/AmiB activator)